MDQQRIDAVKKYLEENSDNFTFEQLKDALKKAGYSDLEIEAANTDVAPEVPVQSQASPLNTKSTQPHIQVDSLNQGPVDQASQQNINPVQAPASSTIQDNPQQNVAPATATPVSSQYEYSGKTFAYIPKLKRSGSFWNFVDTIEQWYMRWMPFMSLVGFIVNLSVILAFSVPIIMVAVSSFALLGAYLLVMSSLYIITTLASVILGFMVFRSAYKRNPKAFDYARILIIFNLLSYVLSFFSSGFSIMSIFGILLNLVFWLAIHDYYGWLDTVVSGDKGINLGPQRPGSGEKVTMYIIFGGGAVFVVVTMVVIGLILSLFAGSLGISGLSSGASLNPGTNSGSSGYEYKTASQGDVKQTMLDYCTELNNKDYDKAYEMLDNGQLKISKNDWININQEVGYTVDSCSFTDDYFSKDYDKSTDDMHWYEIDSYDIKATIKDNFGISNKPTFAITWNPKKDEYGVVDYNAYIAKKDINKKIEKTTKRSDSTIAAILNVKKAYISYGRVSLVFDYSDTGIKNPSKYSSYGVLIDRYDLELCQKVGSCLQVLTNTEEVKNYDGLSTPKRTAPFSVKDASFSFSLDSDTRDNYGKIDFGEMKFTPGFQFLYDDMFGTIEFSL